MEHNRQGEIEDDGIWREMADLFEETTLLNNVSNGLLSDTSSLVDILEGVEFL